MHDRMGYEFHKLPYLVDAYLIFTDKAVQLSCKSFTIEKQTIKKKEFIQ